jgi:hypothetical protein
MGKSIFFGALICIISFGCATQTNYSLNAFYKSKNNTLNLVSKLAIYKSGNYSICTSTLDHEKDHPGDGNYSYIEGIWKQERNRVTLIANTNDGKPLFSFPENENNPILENIESLANPTRLSILNPSGATVSDISAAKVKTQKINGWGNYQRTESLY